VAGQGAEDMRCDPAAHRRAFTLVELLVVIAVIALLIGLLLPAVQKVREAVMRAQCQSNLKQVVLAVHHFHDVNKTMPPYFGIFPTVPGCGQYPWCNRKAVYGGWFAHLLPFVEQDNVYARIKNEITLSNYNDVKLKFTGAPPSGCQVVVVPYNGHSFVTTVCSNPGSSVYENHDIWIDGVHEVTYPILQCPSDPSQNPDGRVYSIWGSTNYLANWNAWGDGQGGHWTPPQRFAALQDGLSNIVLFGEGYANCDTVGRIALFSWTYQTFGLDWYDQPNTFMFQVRPGTGTCPTCCDNWRAQTPHAAMNVALADGSVRGVSPSISQTTWTRALLPRDGQVLGNDW
jgi:prepilin-type N-terminal cleavage/methylation domain-containing protein